MQQLCPVMKTRSWPAIALLMLLPACSDDPAAPDGSGAEFETVRYDVVLESFANFVDFSWGRSANDIYAGTDMILHYDGRTWTPLPIPDESSNIWGGWSLADGSIAYWNGVRIYTYNGSRWDFIAAPFAWSDIFGFPTGDVFVTRPNGDVCRYDGSVWSCESVAPASGLWGLHGTAPDDVYCLGDYGRIVHFDGTSWSTLRADSALVMGSVCGMPDGSAFLTYELRNNNLPFATTRLARYTVGDTLRDADLGSFEPNYLYGAGAHAYASGFDIAGQAIYHYDGMTWQRVDLADGAPRSIAWAIAGEVYTAGSGGLWRTHAGGSERILGGPDPYHPTALWTSPEGDVFALGARARRFDGTRWIDLNKESITTMAPHGMHGTSSRDVWAVGNGMILHFDGTSWTWESGGFQKDLLDVWTDGRLVHAVGRSGAVVSFDGTKWTLVDSPATTTLEAVTGWEGGAFAVGQQGVMLRFDGTHWRLESSPVSWSLNDVVALSPARLIAVGDHPSAILEYRNGSWRETLLESHYDRGGYGEIVSLWADAANDVYVGQYGGDIHHFDGISWSRLPRVMAHGLEGITATREGEVFAVTGRAFLRYRRR